MSDMTVKCTCISFSHTIFNILRSIVEIHALVLRYKSKTIPCISCISILIKTFLPN